MRELGMRLVGAGSPDGEVRADKVAGIATALSDLVLRLTREAADAAGLGRPGSAIERIGEVRLAGLATADSGTRLVFHFGDAGAFDVDPLGEVADGMLWDVVYGMVLNTRPSFTTNTIAEATGRLAGAMNRAAHEVSLTMGGHLPLTVEPAAVDRRVWDLFAKEAGPASVTGVLEAVDLRNGRFRLLTSDEVRIDLVDVQRKAEAAALVSQSVVATGLRIVPEGSGHLRIESAVLAPFDRETVPAPVDDTDAPLPGLE